MKEQIYYSLVPVSEKPEKDGSYGDIYSVSVVCVDATGELSFGFYNFGEDKWQMSYRNFKPIYWLRPITGYFHTREEMEKLIGDSWHDGSQCGFADGADITKYTTVKPTKEQYINSLLK